MKLTENQTEKKIKSGVSEYKGFEILETSKDSNSIYNFVVINIGEGWAYPFDTKKQCMEAVDYYWAKK